MRGVQHQCKHRAAHPRLIACTRPRNREQARPDISTAHVDVAESAGCAAANEAHRDTTECHCENQRMTKSKVTSHGAPLPSNSAALCARKTWEVGDTGIAMATVGAHEKSLGSLPI